MKKLRLTLFLALICSFGYAQSNIIDSLKSELSVATNEKQKVLLLSDLGYVYRLINPDTAFVLSRRALSIAQKNQFSQGEANALSSIGFIYAITGDLQNAMTYQFESMHIAEKGNFENEMAKTYIGLSNIYSDLKDLDVAIVYGKRAYQIFSKLNNYRQMTNTLANIGEAYNRENKLDSALYYLQLSYSGALKKNEYVLTFCLSRLGVVNLKLKNYSAAYKYSQKGLEAGRNAKNMRGQCVPYQTLSKYFKIHNMLDSAIYYAKKGFDLANTYHYKWDMLEGSNALADLYEHKNIKEAYYYSRLAKSLNDTIYGADRFNALQKKLIEEQESVRENKAKALENQNLIKQMILLIGLSIAGIIGFMLYRNNRQKQKANAVLQEKNEEIQSTLSQLKATQTQLIQKEKLASLGELTAGIAHEIQNPLNFVNNFSELSVDLAKELKEEIKKTEKDWELIDDLTNDLSQNQEKINHHGKRASSIVKGMLEHSRASTGIKELTDINKLADEYLRLSYHGLRAKDNTFNADFKTDFDENLPKISVVPQEIGRVLLNLFNNAFYACAERSRSAVKDVPHLEGVGHLGKVWVSTQQINNQIIINVKDNGTGMSEATKAKIFQPFFTTKPTGEGTGLGLSLAYDIITKGHGGTIECESVEGEGTTFIIKLPIQHK